MDRRNFSLLAVAGLLGLTAVKTSQANSKGLGHTSDIKLAGIFTTTGNGSSLGGVNFANDDASTNLSINTHSGDGTLHFNNNGTGKATAHGISIVQDADGSKYTEEIMSTYDFTFTIDKTRKVSIFITADSWKGHFSQGPRKGLSYEKLILNNDLPYFVGYCSSDGQSIELSMPNMIVTKIQSSDGIWESTTSAILRASFNESVI